MTIQSSSFVARFHAGDTHFASGCDFSVLFPRIRSPRFFTLLDERDTPHSFPWESRWPRRDGEILRGSYRDGRYIDCSRSHDETKGGLRTAGKISRRRSLAVMYISFIPEELALIYAPRKHRACALQEIAKITEHWRCTFRAYWPSQHFGKIRFFYRSTASESSCA